ncbi:MAG: primosomal protein N' [Candidatus Cloacimonadota bacterium]|nr:MAG: primosomal protein N' [Candidatus Cloacimonadota bacterium]
MFVEIALPIPSTKGKDTFIYNTFHKKENILIGQRVLVNFNGKLQTGIIVNFPKQITFDKNKIKTILELIDDKPILNKDLLLFANWISQYYLCSIGITLKALLPTGLQVNTVRKVKLSTNVRNENFPEKLWNFLKNFNDFINLSEIKNKVQIKSFYKTIELLEQQGDIEVERNYKRKVEKKTVNFVHIIKSQQFLVDEQRLKLTNKQNDLYQKIKNKEKPFPLAEIAKDFSYSIVQKLKELNLIRIYKQEVYPDIFNNIIRQPIKKFTLTQEQNSIIKNIEDAICKNDFKCFLLYGITGSGKTEIYIRIIKYALDLGKNAILLIPEISLTPQTVERFYSHFPNQIAVIHSKLNDRERLYVWRNIRDGKKRIVIGARSAIFAPIENIGIIVVDEENDSSYKQSDVNPRYNARDMAVVRAKLNSAVVLLGSATPSLESYQNTKEKKYEIVKLTERVKHQKLPKVQIIDLRNGIGQGEIFSKLLKDKIEERLHNKEQVILFQNRRGYASFVQCIKCGTLFTCKNCDISLNYHSYNQKMVCHYCGYTEDVPRKCPECGSYLFNFGAAGTQKIEKKLALLFPSARITRMDADTTQRKHSHQQIFEKMKNGYIDILLGTQMITKGLDFPNVTLVGIVLADTNLNLPDFRSAERTFQLITQVAGRAGRSEKKGEVVVQTYNPNHYAIRFATQQDFDGFAEYELNLRKKLNYPPFSFMIRILFTYQDKKRLENIIQQVKHKVHNYRNPQIIILGPISAPLTKIKNKYRYHLIIKSKNRNAGKHFINWFNENCNIPSYIKMQIDVDPISLL